MRRQSGIGAASQVPAQPTAHAVARRLAAAGVRGSSLYWSVADRLAVRPDAVLVAAGGNVVPTDSQDWTADAIYRGTYERAETALIPRLVKRGGTVVDVGANLGHYTLLAARLVGPSGRVLAFEPSPRCMDILRSAVTALGVDWVDLREAAVGATLGVGALHDPGGMQHSGLASLRDGVSGPHVEVRVETLDDSLGLMDSSGDIDLVKVDTEGFESAVLEGGRRLLGSRTIRHLLLEVSPEFGDVDYVGELVAALSDDYDAYAVEHRGRLRTQCVLVPLDAASAAARCRQYNLLLRRREGGADVTGLVAGTGPKRR